MPKKSSKEVSTPSVHCKVFGCDRPAYPRRVTIGPMKANVEMCVKHHDQYEKYQDLINRGKVYSYNEGPFRIIRGNNVEGFICMDDVEGDKK